jgi:hypothetical protein
MLFQPAVHAINKSKSLIIVPVFLSLAFSFPYKRIASKIGRTVVCATNCSISLWFFVAFAEFSAPKTNSASVISEIAHWVERKMKN